MSIITGERYNIINKNVKYTPIECSNVNVLFDCLNSSSSSNPNEWFTIFSHDDVKKFINTQSLFLKFKKHPHIKFHAITIPDDANVHYIDKSNNKTKYCTTDVCFISEKTF